MDTQLQVKNNEGQHRYEIDLGDEFAVLEYSRQPTGIALLHTQVPKAHEGKGIAGSLAKFALEQARKEGMKVQPLCPFVSAYIRRHPEYEDLVETRSGR